jgi:hypothetical protein
MLGLSPKLDNVCTIQDGIQYSFQKEGQDYLTFLTRSYRGHMSFLMMPSTLFYFDKLQGAKTKMDIRSKCCEQVKHCRPQYNCKRWNFLPCCSPSSQDESVALHPLAGATNSQSNAQKKANVVAEIAKTLHKKGRFDSFDWCHGFFFLPNLCSFDISCERLILAVSMLVQSRTTKLLKGML